MKAPPGITAEVAADSAGSLVDRHRMLEAIPYVRRIEAQLPAPDAIFFAQFAAILSNATIEKRDLHGMTIPATRSTVERIALMREALARLDQAELVPRSVQQRRDIVVTRARLLSVWGFQREAYAEFRAAHRFAPLEGRQRSDAIWIERMLRDPTHAPPTPAPERE